MPTFVPNSVASRQILRNTFEGESPFLSARALNVPVDTPGDRSKWTWAADWRQYVVEGVQHGTGSTLMSYDSTSPGSPAEILLTDSYTHSAPGAYYQQGLGSESVVTFLNNNTGGPVDVTHVALFIRQPNFRLDLEDELLDSYMIAVAILGPFNEETGSRDETPITLAENQRLFVDSIRLTEPSIPGGINFCFSSFKDFVDADEAELIDGIEDTQIYSYPFVFSVIGNSFNFVAQANTQKFPYFKQAYRDILSVSPENPDATLWAEALNVTGPEPEFEAGFEEWIAYRTTRYAVAAIPSEVKYEQQSDFFDLDDEGDVLRVIWKGQSVSMRTPAEFVFEPPSEGSYTYNAIAVFLNPTGRLPIQNQTVNYSNPDNFLGVIKLSSSVTLTESDVGRAYPFNLHFMLHPEIDFEFL